MPKAATTHAERFERIGVRADPRLATQTRDEFGWWVQRTFDLDADRVGDLLLATYEAMANSAEFAYLSAGATGTMDLTASYDPVESTLSVTISDRGQWRTAAPAPGDRRRGRGIGLMTALADHASIQTSLNGTTVRLSWGGVHRR
ncbi:anti-sigma regulatory factor [Mycolicibacterium madagascariense]|uniref:Anti-sigma regulatory factor n=1 Tax=Mycolicibacterium madagascariense TaxID=212765 RepID=A0A7I7XHH7_9MYCO|nr:ATP-binding protein [Mycolicibacterium madagascariense]BBZ28649.1 anti-sigma regulatory factor [Mycolicibacterium madagascariense]